MTQIPAISGVIVLRVKTTGSQAQLSCILQSIAGQMHLAMDKGLDPLVVSEGISAADWDMFIDAHPGRQDFIQCKDVDDYCVVADDEDEDDEEEDDEEDEAE
jgi:hypothetical protein